MSSLPAKRGSGMDADLSSGPAKRAWRFELAASSLPAQAPASRMGADAEAEKDVVHAQVAELPVEVVGKIQARLPLKSLVRSRAVCKAWNAAVTSPILLRERLASRGGISDPWMLLVAGLRQPGVAGLRQSGVAGLGQSGVASYIYDPASARWYKTWLPPWLRDLPVVAREGSLRWLPERDAGPEEGVLQLPPVSEGGGLLLCASSYRKGRETVTFPHLGNPVSSSWTCLPEFPGPDHFGVWRLLGMWVDATARCFKLVAIRVVPGDLRIGDVGFPTFVFDSAIGKWSETTRVVPLPDSWRHWMPGRGVFVGTVLYCGYARGKLLAYDLEQASWSLLDVPKPGLFLLYYATLVSVRGRLLCVAVGRDTEVRHGPLLMVRPKDVCVRIWELDFAGMTWMSLDVMPSSMFAFFYCSGRSADPDSKLIKAVAGQDVVYIMQGGATMIVALDLRRRPAAWSWLPSFPYNQDFVFQVESIQCLDPWLQFGSWKVG